MRVIVIGAGFAGLTAAYKLANAGVDVAVVEARNRVGGRVWSEKLYNGAVIERGAEYVDLSQYAVLSLAGILGLRLAPAGTSFSDREPRGGAGTTSAEVQSAVEVVRRILAGEPQRIDRDSASQVLADAPISDAAKEAIAARIQITSTYPVTKISAYQLLNVDFSNVEGLRIAGGNQQVAIRLAGRLGSKVKLSWPVDTVEWTAGAVRVRSKEKWVEGDRCIITVPVSVISLIEFSPNLPSWKNEAFKKLPYGNAAKLHVPLLRTPSPSAVMSVVDHYWTWTAKGESGVVEQVVSAFAGSQEALDKLRVKEGPTHWVESLRKLRYDLELTGTQAVLCTWHDDPWVKGAHSVRPAGMSAQEDSTLARPVGPLHFAGEHTAGPAVASMDAAVRSGLRAADEILSC